MGALTRLRRYLVPRIKFAYGHLCARLLDLAFLRPSATQRLVRIGTDYGGWYCDPALLQAGQPALCCGAGEDISFDVGLNARWGMRIICVDPTPRSIAHVSSLLDAVRHGRDMPIESGPLRYELDGFRPADFTFLPQAVWSEDGFLELFAPSDPAHVSYSALNLQHTSEHIRVPSKTVESILNHAGVAALSLMKLDIEGAEHAVLRTMLASSVRPKQLLVEFDQVNQPLTPLFWVDLLQMLRTLRAAGYRLVRRESANYAFVLRSALSD